jgi:hypothetical protein
MKKQKSNSAQKQKSAPKQSIAIGKSQNQIERNNSTVQSVADIAILNTLLTALDSEQAHAQIPSSEKSYPDLSQWIDFQHLPSPHNLTSHEPSTTLTPVQLGQRFGNWKILSLDYGNPSCKESHFLLRCDCGAVKAKPQSLILSGQSKSCGCVRS